MSTCLIDAQILFSKFQNIGEKNNAVLLYKMLTNISKTTHRIPSCRCQKDEMIASVLPIFSTQLREFEKKI